MLRSSSAHHTLVKREHGTLRSPSTRNHKSEQQRPLLPVKRSVTSSIDLQLPVERKHPETSDPSQLRRLNYRNSLPSRRCVPYYTQSTSAITGYRSHQPITDQSCACVRKRRRCGWAIPVRRHKENTGSSTVARACAMDACGKRLSSVNRSRGICNECL